MTIRFNDVHAIRLIAGAAQVQFVPKLHHCIANYNEQDILLGGVLFTDFWGGSIGIHMAGFRKNWINKALIYLAFDYPFRQLKVKKLFGLIPEYNFASRNTALRFGFQIEYLIHDVFNNTDGVNGMYVTSMYKKHCRWLNMKMPFIDYAPPERVNEVTKSLAHMPVVGMMQ